MKPGIVVILPTFQCNARCQHCLHSCTPERRDHMPLDLFKRVVQQALERDIGALCLSGGEVFLLPTHIQTAADACREASQDLIIQTNGFWGRNTKWARELLNKIADVVCIGVSIDTVHLREIPIDDVLSAMDLAVLAGVRKMSISVAYQTSREFDVIKEEFSHRYPGISVAGWPILPIGRAARHPEVIGPVRGHTWDCLQRSCEAQCALCPIVHPNGDLHLCYKTVMALEDRDPLILGNLKNSTVGELLRTDSRLGMFVVCLGGGGLGYLLRDSPFACLLDREYFDVCHFCHEVLSRGEVVRYLNDLLLTGQFDGWLEAGLKRVHSGVPPGKPVAKRRIVMCNGKSCGRDNRTYPLIHYAVNKLVETGKNRFIGFEVTDCLNACSSGPNLFDTTSGRLVCGVTRETIDNLIDGFSPEEARF